MIDEIFQFRNGSAVMDTALSEKLFRIKSEHPEQGDETTRGYEWNEMGMSLLFSLLYGSEARYCVEHRAWYAYFEGKWVCDVGCVRVGNMLKEMVRLLNLYCGEILDDEIRKDYSRFVNEKLGDRRMRDRILKDSEAEMSIHAVEFDRNPYLINCTNGTYDLTTCTFREHRPEDFITMQTRFPHTVDRDAKCERWERFITEVTQGDEVKADYIQRALGYSILGRSNEECMFIVHGKTTRNGKSTMLHAIEYMLGDYGTATPVGLICRADRTRDTEAASPELVRLKGKRFVTMNESNEFGKLDEERIKQLTGGESVTARALYQTPITYVPQFTLWLSCNDLPAVSDRSLFASDRIRLIEFNRHFSATEQDKTLKDTLETEVAMSGIFMWLVRGYLKYRRDGLVMPGELMPALEKYEKDNDVVLQFLEGRCEAMPEARIRAQDLYTAYKNWAKAEGHPAYGNRRFIAEVEKHPDWYEKRTKTDGVNYWRGIRLRSVN